VKQLDSKCSGAWPTLITPFDLAGKIDWGAYRTMIEWYIAHGVGGLYANCLSSEMYSLDNEERVMLASEAVMTARGRVRVAATGNLGETTEDHLALCRRMAGTGVDVVMLVVPPFHNSDTALESYYLAMAEKVDAPLGLYECPVPRRYHLGVDLVAKLAHSGRFAAYKETSENLEKIIALQRATENTPLSVLQACSSYLLESVRAGGLGSMCIAAIHLPDLVAAVIEKARSGDADAERLQSTLCALHLAQRAAHPQGSKYLLCKRGLPISAHCRLHNAVLSAEAMQALDYAARTWFTENGSLRVLVG
jgi:4-hydroxy-tetrahydrodipicolinate synthase